MVTSRPAPLRLAAPAPGGRLAAGSAGLKRLQLAMAAAGLGTFAMLYSTQALLPSIGAAFGVGPTAASLTVSVTTGLVGLTVLPMSAVAERAGRTRVMTVALAVACAAVTAGAVCTALWALIASRVLVGLALAGVVAVAMGLVIFTTGFFGCHATASAWVTTRARTAKSHASALYLTAYYAGSSIGGTLIGIAWTRGGWTATALSVAACYAAAACCITGIRDAAPAGRPDRAG